MKRYKMRLGDLKVVDGHPAGNLVDLDELKQVVEGIGEAAMGIGDWVQETLEELNSL